MDCNNTSVRRRGLILPDVVDFNYNPAKLYSPKMEREEPGKIDTLEIIFHDNLIERPHSTMSPGGCMLQCDGHTMQQ